MADKNKRFSWVDIVVFVLFVFLLITMDFNNMTAMNWFSIIIFGIYVLLFLLKFFLDRKAEE
ncbi:L-asparagine transporter-like permease [Geomicrobium halophilum]|uniref:L-asparagine transporter-like permease n=1 Tax=Geomicrobium halophilum TaxID=549000 RepID=A0A841PMR8_9BACL|nr:hypothetical protein [Geomicrobium halophilum]MBB6450039.1 L-asparagine transporter-like permease [Geomicrobium halophilum]